jgi:hypothetical protein
LSWTESTGRATEHRLRQLVESEQAFLKNKKNGRINGVINPSKTATGRPSHMHVDLGHVPSPKKLLRERVRARFRTPEGWGLAEASERRVEGNSPGHCALSFDKAEINEWRPLIAAAGRARKPAPGRS